MTNESIKILLMIMLLAGLRTAIFATETRKSQPGYRVFLDWMMAVVWSALALPNRALQPIVIRRESSIRRTLR